VGDLIVVPVGGKKAGTMVAFEPRTGKSDAGGTWAHPAVTGSRLFIKDREHLLCFETASRRASLDRGSGGERCCPLTRVTN
jgi:hypothetical protein